MNWTPWILFACFGALYLLASRLLSSKLDSLEGSEDIYDAGSEVRASPKRLPSFVVREGARGWSRLLNRAPTPELDRLRLLALSFWAAMIGSFLWILAQSALH